MNQYPEIDSDVSIIAKDPVSGEWFVFIPDNFHLTKSVVTWGDTPIPSHKIIHSYFDKNAHSWMNVS